MTAFDDATAVEALDGEGRFACSLDERFWVIAGPNGGYVAATMVNAIRAHVGAGRALRSLTVHYPRPPRAGASEIEVRVEREGRGLTTVTARLAQGDRLCALALAALATDYPMATTWDEAKMPAVEPPQDADPPRSGSFKPPSFATQFAFRPRFGPMPGAARAQTARVGGWLRLRAERPLDEALVVALTDAWFPAPFALAGGPAFAPTVDLTVHLRAPLPREDPWVLVDLAAPTGRDGFFDEDARLWAGDGTLLAVARQLALLLPLER